MAKQIEWITDMGQALERAQAENKAIFLDFFNPQ